MSNLLTSPLAEQFEKDGYLVVKGLLTPAEVEEIGARFTQIHNDGKGLPGKYEPAANKEASDKPEDPLNLYPRVPMPHRYDETSLRYMLHPRARETLTEILGQEPFAVQTMFYFKPPGARGQELHQDQFYLKVEPGTCVAAWIAIDKSDAENGAMMIVPKTNHAEVTCPDVADAAKSFTRHYVKPPAGAKPVLLEMEPGDALFFNGAAIHGSGPNRSKTRFRRAFISHYATGDAKLIYKGYKPCLNFDGEEITIGENEAGGPCGPGHGGGFH